MTIRENIADVIGETPLIRLRRISDELGVEVLGKLEGGNPAGSVKDRIARAMVEDAERTGRLRPGATLIEPTSGNTGIALAMIAASRGYRLVLTMPEAMSRERVALLKAYGAEVLLTPGTLMRTAVDQAEVLGKSTPDAVLLRQFDNPANPRAHELGTGQEILRDVGDHLDVFVSGIGTGGTVTGVGRALRPRIPGLRIIGVEPSGAAVLSGQAPTGHHIQGIGAGFVPRVLDRTILDEVIAVTEADALTAVRKLARLDGVLAGISSGAALAAVFQVARRPGMEGKRILVVLPDTGERYVSTNLFAAIEA